MNLTKLALRRPVAIFVCILALVIYGVSSIFGRRRIFAVNGTLTSSLFSAFAMLSMRS